MELTNEIKPGEIFKKPQREHAKNGSHVKPTLIHGDYDTPKKSLLLQGQGVLYGSSTPASIAERTDPPFADTILRL